MTAKEFLSQAWEIDKRIERRIEERERLRARLDAGRMANISGMPRGGQFDWTEAADRVIEMDRELGEEISELVRVKRMVNESIEAVEDARYRRVLELRYRNYLSFPAIAEELSYDPRWVRQLHTEALQFVLVPDEFA